METHHTTNPWGGAANVTTLPSNPPTTTTHLSSSSSPTSPSLTSLINIGLLKSTLLPSLSVNSALGLAAYTAGRLTNRLETKDIIWPVAPVLDAWYAAVFRHVITIPFVTGEEDRVTFKTAWRALGSSDKLLLGGVTLWGVRLCYRIVSRAWERGRDDPRYEGVKQHTRGLAVGGKTVVEKGGFWDWAWLNVYLPEALFQSVIALSVTVPFRLGLGGLGLGKGVFGMGRYGEVGQALAVGMFSAGFALEVLADWQLSEFKGKAESHGKMCREGVWSVVRHPNYLGDALVHFSYALLLLANNMLAPVALLGPVTNYLFLRHVGGDKENEESQARRYGAENVAKKVDFDRYRHEQNSFWPDVNQIHNKWAWVVVGCGVAGAVVEKAVRHFF